MTPSKEVRVLAFAAAFMLIGGGCTMPFSQEEKTFTPGEETKKADMSGENLEEQADIIFEAALDEALFEEDVAGDVADDATLFTSDEQELDNFEKSYDESEL